MPKRIEVDQATIHVKDREFEVTHIPSATSGMWFVIHDAFEIWAAVTIDLDGTIVGWRNPPVDDWKEPVVKAIREVWDIPEPSEEGTVELSFSIYREDIAVELEELGYKRSKGNIDTVMQALAELGDHPDTLVALAISRDKTQDINELEVDMQFEQ